MRTSTVLSLIASATNALAVTKGFNYGSTFTDGSSKVQSDFEDEFNTAKALVGTSGFTSARIYTGIQGGTTDTVISAIPAAISTETTLLLGMWASAGQADFDDELTALKDAITQYGSSLADLVVGISVGSEDLYRVSPTGIAALSGAGANPDTLVSYISQVRSAIAGTVLSAAPVGHVDTWTAWVNSSNDAVISACDWVGMDAYPYFQNTMTNPVSDGASLFSSAYEQTVAAVGSKDVWVTETGWPVSGPTENDGVPSLANAETYWQTVGCDILFGKVNTWWYTLQDAQDGTPSPSFGLVGATLSDTPLYDLTCNSSSSTSSSAVSSATATTSKSVASATTPAGASSLTSTISENPVPSASLGESTTGVTASSVASSVVSSAASVATTSAAASGSAAPSTTVSAVTTGSTTSVAAGGKTLTIYQTTLITITSCSTVCVSTTLSTAAASSPASASSVKTTVAASSASATSATASASSSSCPADLSGDYQYPHLIIPVSSASPETAYGTQYFANITSDVSTIFNFDIPESYAGKTCSLVFLFPEKADLETSSYTWNGEGGIVSHVLSTEATESTTYDNAPSESLENGSISSLAAGNSYVISSDSCPAGTTVSFELSSTGGLDLYYFEDWNPSPLGLFVTAC